MIRFLDTGSLGTNPASAVCEPCKILPVASPHSMSVFPGCKMGMLMMIIIVVSSSQRGCGDEVPTQ